MAAHNWPKLFDDWTKTYYAPLSWAAEVADADAGEAACSLFFFLPAAERRATGARGQG